MSKNQHRAIIAVAFVFFLMIIGAKPVGHFTSDALAILVLVAGLLSRVVFESVLDARSRRRRRLERLPRTSRVGTRRAERRANPGISHRSQRRASYATRY